MYLLMEYLCKPFQVPQIVHPRPLNLEADPPAVIFFQLILQLVRLGFELE